MSTLDDLFPDGGSRHGAQTTLDDHHTARRLEQLFGDHRSGLDRTHRASSRPALIALVDGAVDDSAPIASPPPSAKRARGASRRRVDLVGVGAAVLAVVALVVTGAVVGIQSATASPAGEAMGVLKTDEKTIAGVEAGLQASRTRITDEVAAADVNAAALQQGLAGVRDAPDPADIPAGQTEPPADAGTIPIADEAALSAVTAAVDAYRTDLGAITVPELPKPYQRAHVDEKSLPAVAEAIDAAQRRLSELDRITASMRVTRTGLQARTDAFAAQLNAFTASFTPAAQKAVADNPDATADRKAAVTAAAEAIAAADLMTPDGIATLQGYRTAVVELVADQVQQDRVREEQRREQERERQALRNRGQRGSSQTPGSSDPAQPQPPADSGTPPADQGTSPSTPEG